MQEPAVALTSTVDLRIPELVGSSDSLSQVRDCIETAARYREPVLILGETGTGKELVAGAIHVRSDRRGAELVVMNCGAVPAELLISELFGHTAGSFTGADRDRPGLVRAAAGSSLLLDEISETPPTFQVTLLRAVERNEIRPVGSDRTIAADVRFMASSNRSLEDLSAQASPFRSDLLHRLAAFVIEIPPLRRRPEDIEPLALHLLERMAHRYGHRRRLEPGCLQLLADHPFPGNVRELRQVLFRAYAATEGAGIAPAAVDRALRVGPAPEPRLDGGNAARTGAEESGLALQPALKRQIERAVVVAAFNLSKAARLLEIPRSTLQHYLEKYGIETDELEANSTGGSVRA